MSGMRFNDLRSENDRLRSDLQELRRRLEEAEQAIEAIRTGQVESLIVDGPNGPRIFSLEGADQSYRRLVEAMNEGAATLGEDGTILYCNTRFSEMLEAPIERIMGSKIRQHLSHRSQATFEALLREAKASEIRAELELTGQRGSSVPAYLSLSVINEDGIQRFCLVATDLREQKRTEEIAAAERLARSVIEQSAEAVIVCDENGRIIRVSAAAERLCGSNPLMRQFDDTFSITIAPHLERHTNLGHFSEASFAEAVLRGAVACVAPATLRCADGSNVDLLVSANTLRGADDQLRGCVINLVDVTELSRARKDLQESESRFRFLFENLSEGFALHEMIFDEAGCPVDYRFLEVNPAFERMTGLSRKDVVGRRVLDVMPKTEQYWIEVYGAVVRTGEPIHFENYARELGREYEVIAFRPRPGQFAALFVDITERRRVERLYAVLSQTNETIVRTHDEQALFQDVCRIVVEQGEFPVAWLGLVKDLEVTPVAVSGPEAAYLTEIKVEVEGTYGQGPTGTCIRENRPVVNDDFDSNPSTAVWRQSAIRHGIRASAAFPLHKEGKVIGAFTLYARRPGAFDSAQLELLEALCANLSYAIISIEHERKRTETELALREADRLKNEFLAALSHELRNPLAPIKNSLFILEHAVPGSDQAKHALAVIDRQAGQLARLVDDLLDVTRITRNKIQLQRRKLELNELVRLAIEDQRSLFAHAEVRIELSSSPRAIFLDADWNRLTQVVGNLLQNAAKFTSRGGATYVTVYTDPEEKQAVIHVRDTGVGVAAEDLVRLFQPFVQADQTLDRSQGGLGLGLALVKGLVELHGGYVVARSAGLGKGTEFEVRLPIATDEAAVLQPVDNSTTIRRRVLVIEDNTDAADTLREALEFCGHEVDVAYNGLTGIEKTLSFKPDVVLCDIGLPGKNGYEVARALRADARFKDLYIVALSGYAQPEDLQRTDNAGFDSHLAKPPSLEKIEELLVSLPRTTRAL